MAKRKRAKQPKSANPLIGPILSSFEHTRRKKDGLVPRSWLLVVLVILDAINESDEALAEDDLYTYHYALKGSRSTRIPELLKKYHLPTNLGMSDEGVTTRGAPGLRMFRQMKGGGVIMNRGVAERKALIAEAVDLVRRELTAAVGRKPVKLAASAFAHSGTFVSALLKAVENRSQGRVEQALVGAKLQLRFPDTQVRSNPGFAGDRQTGREADFEVGNIRAVVSATPKTPHFKSALALAREGREVYLVVGERALTAAKKQIKTLDRAATVQVVDIEQYVASNMIEIANQRAISARDMCLELAREYNRHAAREYDPSLRVALPGEESK